ncbi:glycoside hydrolase family 5 protein [Zavarzinia sp. CC-PAN008]|uniref:glycoside hydrolase family 5 protein n=1 Tax=Zavarzinia sp. CC-PAN008 TaxID=3243332 RepID=UPI003F746C60
MAPVTLALCVLLGLLVAGPAQAERAVPGGVAPARLAALSPGMNIGHWMRHPGSALKPDFDTHITRFDLDMMKALGVRGVRLPFDPNLIYRPGKALDPQGLAKLDQALDLLLGAGFAVMVVPHDGTNRIERDSAYAAGFAAFWEALARHLSRRDPDRLFLEVLNEPVYPEREGEWAALQQTLIAAMRKGAPRHTLVATGAAYSSPAGVTALTPLADRNVIYTFHFYDPVIFTHQGAPWMGDDFPHLLWVPYPADAARCAKALRESDTESAKGWVNAHCTKGYGIRDIDRQMEALATWSRQHDVPVINGEFGTFCSKTIEKGDRLAWLRDVVASMDSHGIGWMAWGYDDCFALGANRDHEGWITYDEDAARAIGLNPRPK